MGLLSAFLHCFIPCPDSHPEALWLRPALLRRSVLVVFESLRNALVLIQSMNELRPSIAFEKYDLVLLEGTTAREWLQYCSIGSLLHGILLISE